MEIVYDFYSIDDIIGATIQDTASLIVWKIMFLICSLSSWFECVRVKWRNSFVNLQQ